MIDVLRHAKKMTCRLRRLFATLCCIISDDDLAQIPTLWQNYKKAMIEDYIRRGMSVEDATCRCIIYINNILDRCRTKTMSLASFGVQDAIDLGLNNRTNTTDPIDLDTAIENEDYNNEEELNRPIVPLNPYYSIDSFNQDQAKAFALIIKTMVKFNDNIPLPAEYYEQLNLKIAFNELQKHCDTNLLYLDGPRGTGKTFLYNGLLRFVTTELNLTTVAVAWTGIAANLLPEGRTVHLDYR